MLASHQCSKSGQTNDSISGSLSKIQSTRCTFQSSPYLPWEQPLVMHLLLIFSSHTGHSNLPLLFFPDFIGTQASKLCWSNISLSELKNHYLGQPSKKPENRTDVPLFLSPNSPSGRSNELGHFSQHQAVLSQEGVDVDKFQLCFFLISM